MRSGTGSCEDADGCGFGVGNGGYSGREMARTRGHYRYVPGKFSERWFPPAVGEFPRNVDKWATQSCCLLRKDVEGWCHSNQRCLNDDFPNKDSKRS